MRQAPEDLLEVFLYLRFRLLRRCFFLRLILGLSLRLENVINQLRDPAKGTFEPPAQTSGTSPSLRHSRWLEQRKRGKKMTVIITAALHIHEGRRRRERAAMKENWKD